MCLLRGSSGKKAMALVFTSEKACADVMRTFANITAGTRTGDANAIDVAGLPRRATPSVWFTRGLEASSRDLLLAFRAMSVVAFFLMPGVTPALAVTDASTPQIELPEVSDHEIIEALRLGYNLPALSQAVPGQEWLGIVKTECRRLAGIMRSLGYLDADVNVTYDVGSNRLSKRCAAYQEGPDPWKNVKITPVVGSLYHIGIVEADGIERVVPDSDRQQHSRRSEQPEPDHHRRTAARSVANGPPMAP